jgi:H+/Cl- antiporter ClcA
MEMTGSQPMLFWLLLGSLTASVVSRQFCPQAFYHLAAGRFRRQAMVDEGRAAKAGGKA